MSKPHKHKDLIIAWAKGAIIEIYTYQGVWQERANPSWSEEYKYRIKPDTIEAYRAPVKSLKEDPYKELKEAYKAGKQIQFRFKDYPDLGWKNHTVEPKWVDWCDYRIKPKLKLVPFTWEDREQLRGKWIKTKDGKKEFLIDAMYNFSKIPSTFSNMNFEQLLKQCTFLDGSPCGKYVEDDIIEDDNRLRFKVGDYVVRTSRLWSGEYKSPNKGAKGLNFPLDTPVKIVSIEHKPLGDLPNRFVLGVEYEGEIYGYTSTNSLLVKKSVMVIEDD